VVWIFLFSHSVGNVIIPTDELIFFRGVGIPPTRYNSTCPTEFAELITHLQRHEPRRKNSTMWSLHVRNVMLLVVISWLKFILSPTVVKKTLCIYVPYIYMFIYMYVYISILFCSLMLLHQQKAIHFSIQKIPRNPALQARLARKSVKSVPCRRRTLGFVIRISCSDGWPWL